MPAPAPPKLVRTILEAEFGDQVTRIAPVGSGQISDAWYFTAEEREYVLRLARRGLGDTLRKDRFVVTRLAPKELPLPEFVCVKNRGPRAYAINYRAPGRMLDSLASAEQAALVPRLMELLDRIHHADLSGTTGWGAFDSHGHGNCPTWEGFLLAVARESDGKHSFYGAWHRLFDEGLLERDHFEAIFAEMERLIPFCTTERHLVHADYGFDNVLADGGEVTAILDWANALFGDFLFDVAWLALNSQQPDYAALFARFYGDQGREIPHFEERLRCYYCYIGLDALRFYAMTDQPQGYAWMKARLETALEG